MKKILVVYYTQSGQLKRIIDNILSSAINNKSIQVYFEELKPEPAYPFPWRKAFFDCFAESVKEIPCELQNFANDAETKYDLVILGIQTWYISPSIPITSFLKSDFAKKVLKDTPVITVHGSRNMWVSAQEIIKKQLHNLGARLVANIALADKHSNYISAITIIRWLINGDKGPFRFLPAAGISEYDIEKAKNFSPVITESLIKSDYNKLHQDLLKQDSVYLKYHIMKIEFVAKKIFIKFADYVDRKPWGDPKRNKRITHFKIYLLFVLFGLSPIVSVIQQIIRYLFFPLTNKKLAYYRGIALN